MTVSNMREAVRPLMGEKRYQHSLAVEKEAVRLAEKYGVDSEKAAIAGILHDCRKEMPFEQALQIVRQSDIMTEIIFEEQPQLIHGFSASLTLGEFGVTDSDIIHAVRYHTVARRGMSPLEMVVYLADLTAEGRDYPDVLEMRRAANQSLQAGMAYALKFTLGKLLRLSKPICRETWEAYNYYCTAPKKEEKI